MRRVYFAGCTNNPDQTWMKQIARNLIGDEDGFLKGKRFLIMDRDGKFCPAFRETLITDDIKPLLLPPKSPNLNAHMERFHRSIKAQSLSKMILFSENSLRRAVVAYLAHYHAERNHQGPDNALIEPGDEIRSVTGKIECRERLGGMLK